MSEPFVVETSAKHLHVAQADLEVLFGEGHQLTPIKDLSQPGQFACDERVTVVGPKNELKNIRILGPARKETQVELSATDCRAAGIPAVVRESGDLEGTPGCKIVGPCGEIELSQGVIVAKRHIHMTCADAEKYGVENGEIVDVKVESDERTLTFGDVVVRVSDSYALAMHIDTDESNAVLGGGSGVIVK